MRWPWSKERAPVAMPTEAEAVAAWDRWVEADRAWREAIGGEGQVKTREAFGVPIEGVGVAAWRQEVGREVAWRRMEAARLAWEAVVERGRQAVRARFR